MLVYALCHTNPFFISITITNDLIHRTICHRVSTAIRIGRSIRLPRRQQYVLTDQYVIAEEQQYVLVNQYVIQNRQQYALIVHIEIHIVLFKVWYIVLPIVEV